MTNGYLIQLCPDLRAVEGRLPDDPAKLEKDVEGVGRYTAGAICSMAYGVKTPIVSWVLTSSSDMNLI